MTIIRNSAKCLECGDEIESTHRHDFRGCSCGNLFVDGGKDYLRRLYKDGATVEETSIIEQEEEPDGGEGRRELPEEAKA